MTPAQILQPLFAGLSVGFFCLSYCFPFMGSLLAAEHRPLKTNGLLIFEFLAGRLIGYLLFGILLGYLGERLDYGWLRLMADFSFIALSIFLVLYLLGLMKNKSDFCNTPRFLKNRSPLWMGLLMGINVCPPFLLSAVYVFKQQSPLYGVFYFALFFLSSSVYFLPLLFIGLAARAEEFRTMARLSGFGVALIFFVYGIYSVFHNIRGSL